MIGYLNGTIIASTLDYIIVEVNGVGYKVFTTDSIIRDTGKMFIFHSVGSDNQHNLYGLRNFDQLSLFEMLIKVSGVGPKIAQKIIESSNENELTKAINDGDVKYFTNIKGLGKKNAQKIILELKNKLVDVETKENEFTYDALLSLGFSKQEIKSTLDSINTEGLSDEQIIEQVLKNIR